MAWNIQVIIIDNYCQWSIPALEYIKWFLIGIICILFKMIESDSILRGAEISLQFRKPLGKGSLSTHCFCFSANFLCQSFMGNPFVTFYEDQGLDMMFYQKFRAPNIVYQILGVFLKMLNWDFYRLCSRYGIFCFNIWSGLALCQDWGSYDPRPLTFDLNQPQKPYKMCKIKKEGSGTP